MEQPDYTQINIRHPPPDIIQQYNPHEKIASDRYVYIKTKNECIVKKICSIGIQKLSLKTCSEWLYTLQIFYRPLATCNEESKFLPLR